MKETERIADQLRRAFNGEAWSGPSLQDTLAAISAAQAAAHPLAGAHSIGELVRHLATWAATVARRVEARASIPPVNEDWPPFPSTPDKAAWQQAQEELQEAQGQLVAVAEQLPEDALDTVLPAADGPSYSLYVLLHGAAQHYLYHAGQIALLRKFV